MNDRETAWLFRDHPQAQLRQWAARLQLFRFCRAYGGNNNDGDALRLVLTADVDRALEIVEAIGARPRPRDAGAIGRHTVRGRDDVEQPGWCDVGGDPVWLYLGSDGTLDVQVQDPVDVWTVTDEAVRIAAQLEPKLAPFATARLDPPDPTWRCIAPQTHPELFARPPAP